MMSRRHFILVCCLLAVVTAVTAIVPLAIAQAQAESRPTAQESPPEPLPSVIPISSTEADQEPAITAPPATIPPATIPLPTTTELVDPEIAPFAPHSLRLDPLYDTVLEWRQERNPPHYVYGWDVYLDGHLQATLRTNRYNMPIDARKGVYTIRARTEQGAGSALSEGFRVG